MTNRRRRHSVNGSGWRIADCASVKACLSRDPLLSDPQGPKMPVTIETLERVHAAIFICEI